MWALDWLVCIWKAHLRASCLLSLGTGLPWERESSRVSKVPDVKASEYRKQKTWWIQGVLSIHNFIHLCATLWVSQFPKTSSISTFQPVHYLLNYSLSLQGLRDGSVNNRSFLLTLRLDKNNSSETEVNSLHFHDNTFALESGSCIK